jgi:hypothetical protein
MAAVGDAMVDLGKPVGHTVTVGSDGSTSDGGGANPVTGCSIIRADNLDAALALVAGRPILASYGGSVEVGETVIAM